MIPWVPDELLPLLSSRETQMVNRKSTDSETLTSRLILASGAMSHTAAQRVDDRSNGPNVVV